MNGMGSKLTEDERERIIELYVIHPKTMKEISALTGRSVGSVHNVIERAREKEPEILQLRSLNRELRKVNANVIDAYRGGKFLEKLGEMNVSIDHIPACIGLLRKYGERASEVLFFGQRLEKIEEAQGKPYEQIISEADEKAEKIYDSNLRINQLQKQENALKESIREYEPLVELQKKLDRYNLNITELDGFIDKQLKLEKLGFSTEIAENLAHELAKKGIDPREATIRLAKALSQYGELEDAIATLTEERMKKFEDIEKKKENLETINNEILSSQIDLKNIEKKVDERSQEYQNTQTQIKIKKDELEAVRKELIEVKAALDELEKKLSDNEPIMTIIRLINYPTAHAEPYMLLKGVRGIIEGFKINIKNHPDLIDELYQHTSARIRDTTLFMRPPQRPHTLERRTLIKYLDEIDYTLMEGLKHVARKPR